MANLGRLLMVMGALILIVGALLAFGPRIPWLGRLPGDIVIERKNFSFYFPLMTSIVISVLLTLLMALFRR